MKQNSEMDDELRPEYDINALLKGAVRGKYAQYYAEGTGLILLDSDVADAFPTASPLLTLSCPRPFTLIPPSSCLFRAVPSP